MKILIVEDARVMAQSLTRQLARLGYADTTVAASAEDALECLRDAGGFDLIMLDWMLPQMSGLEMLRMVRASRRFAQTPVVMITSNDEQDDVLEAFKAGATDYIIKPFAPALLEEKMTGLVRKYMLNP